MRAECDPVLAHRHPAVDPVAAFEQSDMRQAMCRPHGIARKQIQDLLTQNKGNDEIEKPPLASAQRDFDRHVTPAASSSAG